MLSRRAAADLVRRLDDERPSFHGAGDATNWQLDSRLLHWLVGEVRLGGRTLETGCGYSTVTLSALASEHTCISPVAVEHERIRSWCAVKDVDLGNVDFVFEESERHLAAQSAHDPGTLDLVLIDGDHAFPVPALDWYFTAPLLALGGLMVIDDTQIRACAQVANFLRADQANWRFRHTVGEAAVFVKVGDQVHGNGDWRQQPWNSESWSFDTKARSVLRGLRAGLDPVRRTFGS